jgi:hypothetical protein
MRHIHPLQPLAVIVLIAVLWYVKRKPGAKGAAKAGPAGEPRAARPAVAKVEEPPEVVYMKLRQQALEKDPARLGLPGELEDDEPYGVLMEMGIPSSVVTLACFADGDAGIYYKTGGGMKGGVAHDNVRRAAKEFIALSQKALPRMIRTTSHPLPDVDKVRFYVLTPRGTFTTEAHRQALGATQSDLSALFYSGQEVVAQMRQVQEQRAS